MFLASFISRAGRLSVAAAGALLLAVAPQGRASDAHFVVGTDVVNPDLQPFTATIGPIGNGSVLSRGSGFEPTILRTQFRATRDAENRIYVNGIVLSAHDSWRTGAFDGAEVEVFRIENGVFRSVRTDRIAVGGFNASGWVAVNGRNIVPEGTTRFTFAWAPWNRPDVPYYFTVRAVDSSGDESDPAQWVSATRPREVTRGKAENPGTPTKLSGRASQTLPAPANLAVEVTDQGRAILTWDPVPGAVGYTIYRSDLPPSRHRGYFIDLAGTGPAIRAGDLVVMRDRFTRADRGRVATNRVWDVRGTYMSFGQDAISVWSDAPDGGDWHLVEHDRTTPVEDPGATFLRVSLKQGERFLIGNYNHAGDGQEYYMVLEPGRTYRFEVWARGRTTRPVTFMLTGPYSGRGDMPAVRPVAFSLSPEWKKISATFSVPALYTGDKPGRMELQLDGPGEFDLDNFRIYRDDAPFLALLPEDEARLKSSGMSALRTHGFVKTGIATYDLEQLTNPGGATHLAAGNTLPQVLTIMERAGMDPWLQIEPHFSAPEWLGLAEYLAAPFDPETQDAADFPWAAKRVAQGHAAPWTESFDRILFEIGNETWNRIMRPWIFEAMTDAATGRKYTAGEVYGLYQEYVLSVLRSSPYWPALADKIEPVLGGWNGNGYGDQAAAVSPNSRLLAYADYIGGWDQGEGPVGPTPAGFSRILTQALQAGIPSARKNVEAAREVSAGRETPLLTGTYESGPGYALNGLNKKKVSPEEAELQEIAMKSVAAGTATLDGFLARAREGYTIQNFFTFDSGLRWTSFARWNRGGANYPSWEMLALFNRVGPGDMLKVEALDAPTADIPEAWRRQAVTDAPMIDAYATRKGDRLTLVLVSRLVPGTFGAEARDASVTVDLPFAAAGKLTRYRMSGGYDASNANSRSTELITEPLPAETSAPRLEISDLAPGSAQVLVFEQVAW